MVVVFFGKFCSVTDQQVRGWLAACRIIIRRRCRLADRGPRRSDPGCRHLGAGGRLLDWHPGDRLPYHAGESAVLPPVSPAEPADPGAVPQRRRNLSSDPGILPLPWRRQRRLRPSDRPDAVADTDSPPCACFAGASYPAGPAPPPPRPIKRISKRKAITIEQRALRAEKKRKPREKKGRYCKTCKLDCNSLLAFADHVKSHRHVYRSDLTRTTPHCDFVTATFLTRSSSSTTSVAAPTFASSPSLRHTVILD